jgi:hypothetical protein
MATPRMLSLNTTEDARIKPALHRALAPSTEHPH